MTATLALTTEKRALHFTVTLPQLRLPRPMRRIREPNPPRSFRTEAPLAAGRPLFPDTAMGRRWPPIG